MPQIKVLDNQTIDKIAAGEVVERPMSVVKELVENSIDAGATAITIEIKDGGITFIRVTDNGSGIPEKEVRDAFLRHATSKISTAEDLSHIHSLGFRGEALSSIAAVAQVEMMTKTRDSLMGVHCQIEDGKETGFARVGVPDGTTILVKNLFFHTPARRKFLKTAATEGSYIADLCEHLAMSKPEISFRFIVNGQVKFHTSGNGDIQEIIYRIFGREFMKELLPIEAEGEGMKIQGFLGKPSLNRSNRNFENCFINGRFVKSNFLYKAIEEGYRSYLMQHKFPFAVLYFTMDTEKIDVNVHPTKMDIRITDSQLYFDFIVKAISEALQQKELIPDMESTERPTARPVPEAKPRAEVPEPFEKKRMGHFLAKEDITYLANRVFGEKSAPAKEELIVKEPVIKAAEAVIVENPIQMNFFDEKIIKAENKDKFMILGQVFDTYWLVAYEDKLLFVDQHAAHEKVKYEKLMKEQKTGEVLTQSLHPPLIFQLTQKEEGVLAQYQNYFEAMGFVWEDFGEHAIAMRSMPVELYGKDEKHFFQELLDDIVVNGCKGTPEVVAEKLASMACKAAVKGNQPMNRMEMNALLEQLFTLENPYHCPHGRPTMISMSKSELEKRFKRIV